MDQQIAEPPNAFSVSQHETPKASNSKFKHQKSKLPAIGKKENPQKELFRPEEYDEDIPDQANATGDGGPSRPVQLNPFPNLVKNVNENKNNIQKKAFPEEKDNKFKKEGLGSEKSSQKEQKDATKDVKNQFQKNLLTAFKKKQHEKTINAIIKRSMTQKFEAEQEKIQEEYVPTMKDKFMKHKINQVRCMIRHKDSFRVRWDIWVMALALWNCLSIPFDVAFEPVMPIGYVIFEYFVDLCFILDIFVAFRTTYINEKTGDEVVEGHLIALNYIIKGSFFVDLASSIPFEQLYLLFMTVEENVDNSENVELKLFGVLKLVRLLRLSRILRYLKFK